MGLPCAEWSFGVRLADGSHHGPRLSGRLRPDFQGLLDAGSDVNAKDVRGMTPIMLATATDHQDPAVLKLLLDHGADPAVPSKIGENGRGLGP